LDNLNTSQSQNKVIAMTTRYKLPLSFMRIFCSALILPGVLFGVMAVPNQIQTANAQASNQGGSPLRITGEFQEYNAKAQIATVRGNVQLLFKARGIQATAAQAQYLIRERRIVLTGDVYVLQQGGNSLRAERVDYLIDEGRFVAAPRTGGQVESIYIINETNVPASPASQAPNPRRSR
jgi:lipopolysaccharide export system protein LptA